MTPIEKAKLFRKRFEGREDVYAVKWYDKETGKGQYAPVCENKYKPGCHLKTKSGVTCAKCEIKATENVTYESVLKHISGQEEHGIYVLRTDGTIKFGALDLDCKPNRPMEKNYYFNDAKILSDALTGLGVNHYIARSTTEGFHIYMFLSEYYSAAKFRTVMQFIFEKTGMAEMNRQGTRLLPEVYPKQAYAGGVGGLGNCIKPPMIEPMFANGKNCWITFDGEVIQKEHQWETFANIPDNTPEMFDKIIEQEALEVKEVINVTTRVSKSGGIYNESTGQYEPKTAGSFEKILEGCASLRKLRERMDTGYAPAHDEGFGLFHMAINTMDGIKYFKDGKIPGWGDSDKDWKQLRQSMDKNYAPWTCKKFQEKGICPSGTKCFDKRPPAEVEEGQYVIKDDLPETEWVDPSPIRYAYGDGEAFLAKLIKDVDETAAEENIEKKITTINAIIKRAQVFDDNQQGILKKHIHEKGLMKKTDLNKTFKEAAKEKEKELVDAASKQKDTRHVNGVHYRKLTPYGYSISKKLKGSGEGYSQLCNFDVVIEEQRTTQHEDGKIELVFAGYFAFDGKKRNFEIPSQIWSSDRELYSKLYEILGYRCNISKADLDDARQAWAMFSPDIEEKLFYVSQGWYDDTFITSSILVDKDGVKPNTAKPLNVGIGHNRYVNFKTISEGELRDILFHIKTDLFNAFPRGPLFMGIAHTFFACIHGPLGILHRPTLWYEGLTGRGKTSLTKILQSFYGNFMGKSLNWSATYKAMIDYCYSFKDCLLVIDDYKARNKMEIESAEKTVQYGYDGTSRAALSKDGTQRGDKYSRCLIISSGEDTPFGEASIISRMYLIPYPQTESEETQVKYEACMEMLPNYSGVTPMFLKFFLNQDKTLFKRDMRNLKEEFFKLIKTKNNAARISDHFSYNHVSWKIFINFMKDYNAIDDKEAESLIAEHFEYCKLYSGIVATRCSSEQQGILVIDILKEIIHSHRVSLRCLPGYEDVHKPEIGFVRPGEDTKIYIHPQLVRTLVKREGGYDKLEISLRAVGEQLAHNKIILEYDKEGWTKQVLDPDKKHSVRMWVMDRRRLGFEASPVSAVKQEPLNLPEPILKDGLI